MPKLKSFRGIAVVNNKGTLIGPQGGKTSIYKKDGSFTVAYLKTLNKYTSQILQHEDLDRNELSNRLKQFNIINDDLNIDKLNAYLSSKARDINADVIIIDYEDEDEDDDKYGLNTRLTKEQRNFRHKHKMRRIARFIKNKKSDLEQGNHMIQIIFSITTQDNTNGEVITRPYNTGAIPVEGGKYKIAKAIKKKEQWVKDLLTEDYNKTVLNVRIDRLYIDEVKQIREDLTDEPMYGEQPQQLEFCGYNMKLKRFTIKNACSLEYHVEMFNKKRWNGWTTERLMKELGMNSIDEGVTLKMLIPIYNKYRIPYHCVDFE